MGLVMKLALINVAKHSQDCNTRICMLSGLHLLEAFLWLHLMPLIHVTLITLTVSVSSLLNLLLMLVACLLFLNPQCLASISRWITASIFFQAEDGIRDHCVTGVQTCALPIFRLNVVKLDYSAIIDRISRSFDYESCLLGLTNVDLDPDAQMNVWLSSASNHQWSPNQPSPSTPWEAEIDRLMQAQGSELNPAKRKAYFDKVQEIVSQEVPFLYLVTRNALVAVSPSLQNANPTVLRPQVVWNIETLALATEGLRK